MVVKEIVRTCSNAEVAHAAVASIGGKFAENFAAEASRNHLTAGMLTSLIVKEFSANASFDQMAEVDAAAAGADQPILSGLRHILIQSGITKLAPVGDLAPKTAGGASVLTAPGAAQKTAELPRPSMSRLEP